LRTQDIAVIGICAAVYAVVGRLTDLGLTFVGVAFFPAVVIPAVFAVLFGPWVGGFGGAIGIFIRDMLFHGNAFLSLTVGVPANFVVFFLIGYFASREIDMKRLVAGALLGAIVIVIGLLLPTVLLPTQFASASGLSQMEILIVFAPTVIAILAVILAVSKWRPKWRNFVVGSLVGQAVAALLLSVSYWGYSQLFFDPTGYIKAPFEASIIPILFIWTFATEIPFVLFLGPPIIRACRKAFPSLQPHPLTPKIGEAID
jgi:uncharacterized membrane protein